LQNESAEQLHAVLQKLFFKCTFCDQSHVLKDNGRNVFKSFTRVMLLKIRGLQNQRRKGTYTNHGFPNEVNGKEDEKKSRLKLKKMRT